MANSYLFSVSYDKGCYRHIRIDASETLAKLSEAILEAFDFSDDHAHAFFLNNSLWDNEDAYYSVIMEDAASRHSADYTLLSLSLNKGQQFKYLFDYGDEHIFQCRVLQILDEATETPTIIRSVGASPVQYPDWEEDWDDEEDAADREILWPEEELPGEDATPAPLPLPETYPEETIQQLLDELPLSDNVVSQLYTYFLAAARLYGIIPLSELFKLYNLQNPPISQADFLAFAEVFYHAEASFVILGKEHLYLDAEVAEPMERELIDLPLIAISMEMYYAVRDSQQDKTYAILPKEEFLCYADPGWYPTTVAGAALEALLASLTQQTAHKPEDLMADLSAMASLNTADAAVLQYLSGMGIKLNSATKKEGFLTLYHDFCDNTRTYSNRGHTNVELRRNGRG